MNFYTFGDVLRVNDLPRNRLKRWTQAGIITPALQAGGGTMRRFSFRDLIAAAICDDLRGIGVGEDGLRRALALGLDRAVVADRRAPGMAAGHQDGARRRAHGVAGVMLREAHPLGREAIERGQADLLLPVAAELAPA